MGHILIFSLPYVLWIEKSEYNVNEGIQEKINVIIESNKWINRLQYQYRNEFGWKMYNNFSARVSFWNYFHTCNAQNAIYI